MLNTRDAGLEGVEQQQRLDGRLEGGEETPGFLRKRMQDIVKIQSIFRELVKENVRNALIRGQIFEHPNLENVLDLLDIMSDTLVPNWSGNELKLSTDFEVSAVHWDLLMSGSNETFHLNLTGPEFSDGSYREWWLILTKIMDSYFWKELIKTDHEVTIKSANTNMSSGIGRASRDQVDIVWERSSHTGEVGYETKDRDSNISKRSSSEDLTGGSVEFRHREHRSSSSGEDIKHHRNSNRESRYSTKLRRADIGSPRIEVGRNHVKFADSSSEDEKKSKKMKRIKGKDGRKLKKGLYQVEASDTSSDDAEYSSSDTERHCKSHRSRHRIYDVVVPPKYETDGPVTLTRYLDGYERYFSTKYDGTQRECALELARFLTGETKDAYEAIGGAYMKYRELKPRLLDWFKSQKVSQVQQSRESFARMKLKPSETLKLFCMRLENSAVRAYPGDERRQSRELKKKLIDSTPSWFMKVLEKRKDIKRMMKQGKSLSWGEIVETAEDQDKKMKKKGRKPGESNEIELKEKVDGVYLSTSHKGMYADGGISKEVIESRQPVVCEFCGVGGHPKDGCWRRLGACIICGSVEHFYRECKRYNPNYIPVAQRQGKSQGLIPKKRDGNGGAVKCQLVKWHQPQKTPPIIKIETTEPFELMAADNVIFPKSPSGYIGCCVLVDQVSKWLTAVPIRDACSLTMVKVFETVMLPSLLKLPRELLTNNGAEFISSEFKALLDQYSITHISSNTSKASSFVAVETINRNVGEFLRSMSTDTSWESKLTQAVVTYNNTYHGELGMSPAAYLLSKVHHPRDT